MTQKKPKGEQTRARILDTAQRIVLSKGFTGASIDEIVQEAGLTKGGFFYHFRGKSDLARALMERYLAEDDVFFRSSAARADELSEDPLQRFLIFLMLMAQAMEELSEVHPGCLVASFTYESQQIDPEVRRLAAEGVRSWRAMFAARLEPVVAMYPMRVEVAPDVLADMLTTVFEGSIVVSKTVQEPDIVAQQLRQYRQYIRLLFGDVK